jgi:mannose-6-phosphate isomerase-like protein (cupin superfamily)
MVDKPWGNYSDLYRDKNLVLKKITVNPKSRLSLQYHNLRSEFWIVMKGCCICETYNGQKYFDECSLKRLCPGDTVQISMAQTHRLINDSNEPCEIAELQYGDCDEEDIFRLEDDYNRQTDDDIPF